MIVYAQVKYQEKKEISKCAEKQETKSNMCMNQSQFASQTHPKNTNNDGYTRPVVTRVGYYSIENSQKMPAKGITWAKRNINILSTFWKLTRIEEVVNTENSR